MKKLCASILLLIYFTVSTGFVVSVHYCMNKVDSIQLGDAGSDECSKCGMHMEDSGGCCKNDVKMVKMQADQAFAKIVVPDFALYIPAHLFHETFFTTRYESPEESHPLAHGPPLEDGDIYLHNCVFRL